MPTWSKCKQEVSGKVMPIYINLDNVVSVGQESPDTVTAVVMANGDTVLVQDSPDEVISR
jgi:uncharacterized protein YlzI (FlbEa/FlbD family)